VRKRRWAEKKTQRKSWAKSGSRWQEADSTVRTYICMYTLFVSKPQNETRRSRTYETTNATTKATAQKQQWKAATTHVYWHCLTLPISFCVSVEPLVHSLALSLSFTQNMGRLLLLCCRLPAYVCMYVFINETVSVCLRCLPQQTCNIQSNIHTDRHTNKRRLSRNWNLEIIRAKKPKETETQPTTKDPAQKTRDEVARVPFRNRNTGLQGVRSVASWESPIMALVIKGSISHSLKTCPRRSLVFALQWLNRT